MLPGRGVASLTVFGRALVAVLVSRRFATLLVFHAALRWLVWRRCRSPVAG